MGQAVSKWITSSKLSVHNSLMICEFILSGQINLYCHNTQDKNQLDRRTWYHQNKTLTETLNITNNGPAN